MPTIPPQSSRSPAGPLRVISSFRVGERVVARCGDGLLAAENALFDAKETVLRTTAPATMREAGYLTTAREALGRLAMAGITPEFAHDAARTIPHDVAASFARGETARTLVTRLGPHELFDGAVYSAAAQRYEGVWLDLRALSTALNVPSAPVVLQALHLAAALAEVSPTATVLLSTSATRRPSERAHFRMILEGTRWLLEALYRLPPNPRPPDAQSTNDDRMREVLLARVRERATVDASAHLQRHLGDLENAIAGGGAPRGAVGGGEFAAIDRQLVGGDAFGVDDRIDQLEGLHGVSAGTRYLRARLALLRGEASPHTVATTLSKIVDEDGSFHEACLLAARAWHAAGDSIRARHYARRIVEDPLASDGERLVALEILETTSITNQSMSPPPVVIEAPNYRGAVIQTRLARVPLYPTLGDAPPPVFSPPAAERERDHQREGDPEGQPRFESTPPSDPPPSIPGPSRYDPELVESLSLPTGTSEAMLGADQMPTNAQQARVAMTRLSRDLARDYRLWYSKSLRCDVMAIEAMQRHIATRFTGAPISDPGVAWELCRHGALISEIAARSLGGEWVDVAPSEPGYWTMLVSRSLRTRPIGRVHRFVALGNRERDLVSYYLDLEARARKVVGAR